MMTISNTIQEIYPWVLINSKGNQPLIVKVPVLYGMENIRIPIRKKHILKGVSGHPNYCAVVLAVKDSEDQIPYPVLDVAASKSRIYVAVKVSAVTGLPTLLRKWNTSNTDFIHRFDHLNKLDFLHAEEIVHWFTMYSPAVILPGQYTYPMGHVRRPREFVRRGALARAREAGLA